MNYEKNINGITYGIYYHSIFSDRQNQSNNE